MKTADPVAWHLPGRRGICLANSKAARLRVAMIFKNSEICSRKAIVEIDLRIKFLKIIASRVNNR